jgi:hypothetical protein
MVIWRKDDKNEKERCEVVVVVVVVVVVTIARGSMTDRNDT